MSYSYDLKSPFKTPSKSRPANTFQDQHQQQQPSFSDSFYINESQFIYPPQQVDEIPDEEISKVDALLDLHDTDEDEELQQHERSNLFGNLDDEDFPDSQHTPRFTPRKGTLQARRESQSATVLELSKLVVQMKENSDEARSTNSKISSILIVLAVLFAILLASSHRPYCTEYSWYPCQQCPKNAVCSLLSIEKCLHSNYTIYENQVCIRNDSTGLLSYQFANIARDHLEQLAYKVDCLGNHKITKKVQRDNLLDLLISQSISDYTRSRPESTFTHAFNTMISVFEDNEDVFKIALESDQTFVSFRFQSVGSCLFTKYHFRGAMKSNVPIVVPEEEVEEVELNTVATSTEPITTQQEQPASTTEEVTGTQSVKDEVVTPTTNTENAESPSSATTIEETQSAPSSETTTPETNTQQPADSELDTAF